MIFDNKNLAHFYIFNSNDSAVLSLENFLNENEINSATNPDYFKKEVPTFTIDESRHLQNFFQSKSWSGNKKIAHLIVNSITREAQNSLLKLTEEPPENAHIFLILPDSRVLLSTLLSRSYKFKAEDDSLEIFGKDSDNDMLSDFQISDDFNKFYKLSLPKKLDFVSKIITKKDTLKAKEIYDESIKYLSQKKVSKNLKASDKIKNEDILQLIKNRSYLNDQSHSLKLLLEHLCFILSTCIISKD